MNKKNSEPSLEWKEWARKRDSMKTLWVVAVVCFWISTAILGVVFFLEDELNILLLSVSLGTMVLGVWLKARFQLYQNREPEKQRPDEGDA